MRGLQEGHLGWAGHCPSWWLLLAKARREETAVRDPWGRLTTKSPFRRPGKTSYRETLSFPHLEMIGFIEKQFEPIGVRRWLMTKSQNPWFFLDVLCLSRTDDTHACPLAEFPGRLHVPYRY